MSKSIDFIRDFLAFVENHGIYDEFDKETQKMVTSSGVQSLINKAQECLPEKLKPGQAMQRMRDLNDDERNKLIMDAEVGRVIDLRKAFQLKMSKNKGAQGIVENLVKALNEDPNVNLAELILDAQALVNGPENVISIKE